MARIRHNPRSRDMVKQQLLFAKGALTIVIQKPEAKISKSQSIPINPKKFG